MSSLEDSQVNQLKDSFRSSAPAQKQEKPAKKSSKIKISVTSIRKNEKKHEENNNNKNTKRSNNFHRSNNRSRQAQDRNKQRTNPSQKTSKPVAQDLLKQLKQKQRVDEKKLDRQSERVQKSYNEDQTTVKKSSGEDNKKTTKSENKVVKVETTAPKVTGPKIIKPSPARMKNTQKASPVNKPKALDTNAAPEPAKEEKRRGNGHGRN